MPKSVMIETVATNFDVTKQALIEQIKGYLPSRSTKVRTVGPLRMDLDANDPADKQHLDLFAAFEMKIASATKAMNAAKPNSVEAKTAADEVKSHQLNLARAKRLVFGSDGDGTIEPESFLDALHQAIQAVNASEWINGDMITIEPKSVDATAWTYGLQRMKRRAKQDRQDKPVKVGVKLAELAKLANA